MGARANRPAHYHLHDGKPVPDPATGEPLRHDGPTLRGMDIMFQVAELRARVLGLYAPQRHHLTLGGRRVPM